MKKIFLQVNHDYVLYVLFVKVREGIKWYQDKVFWARRQRNENSLYNYTG